MTSTETHVPESCDRMSNEGHKNYESGATIAEETSQETDSSSETPRKTIDETDIQDGTLERTSSAITAQDEQRGPDQAYLQTVSTSGPLHSAFTRNQKRFIVVMASWAGFFSPVSANIYFPALNSLARDLHVTSSLINLTLTSYMIFQGLAPSVIGNLADSAGRRPAYAICFIIYIAANIGLALQRDYAALFVLRCIQSSGSSGTIALSSGVVSDVATAAERGKYLGFITAGSLLGPSIGPVVGGILSQFLGWASIFWFLTIFAVTFFVAFLLFFPETARTAVGNGSIPPKGWNMSVLNYLALRRARKDRSLDLTRTPSNHSIRRPAKKPFNPLASVQLLGDLETSMLLIYNAFLFAAFYDVTASLPNLFAKIYGFNDLQIGLCYLPFGVGCCVAAVSNGQLLDRNFRRWAKKLKVPIQKGRQQDLRDFPIEKVRLQIAFPMLYIACVVMIIYGWVLQINGPLAAVLVLLFIASLCMTATFNVISTLLIDFYPKQPATATAANNLLRCLLGAGATGVVQPMLNAMGRGWTFTFVALCLLVSSPILFVIYFKGPAWRRARLDREDQRAKQKKAKRAQAEEEGIAIQESGEKVDGEVETTAPPVEGTEGDVAATVVPEMEKEEGIEREEQGLGAHPHPLSRVLSHETAGLR